MHAQELKAELETAHCAVWPVIDEFERVARGEDTAYHLSGALDLLSRRVNGSQISQGDREALVAAIEKSRMTVIVMLPPAYPRDQARTALAAAISLVDFWAASDTERKNTGSRLTDLRAAVRILQNDVHNLELVEQMAERARRRGEKAGHREAERVHAAWTVGAR